MEQVAHYLPHQSCSPGNFIRQLRTSQQDNQASSWPEGQHFSNVQDHPGQLTKKLTLVNDYNSYMGGVDRNDEMISFSTAACKTTKWDKKLATHIMEEGTLN